MERIRKDKPAGLHAGALRTFGMMFLLIGIVGRSIFQNQILGMGHVTSQELLEALQSSNTIMMFATASLIMQAMETCAVPLFAFLLAEGVRHTRNFRRYFFRVLGVALLSEIPYNLALSGTLLDFSTRNPAFGLVLALIVLYVLRKYEGKGLKNIALKCIVTLAAILWGSMLRISYGGCMVILASVLWLMRNKPLMRGMAGAGAAMLCSLYSLYFMASPMSFLPIHFYNGEQGPQNKVINYLAYPVLLLAVFAMGQFL